MSERLNELADRHLLDELTADEKRELAELLDSDASAARRFVEAVEFDTSLHSVMGNTEASEPKTSLRLMSVLPWLLAAAACVVAAVLAIRQPEPEAVDSAAVPVPAADRSPAFAAIAVNEANARFADGRVGSDVAFPPGDYQLEAGAIHLRFSSGVDMVLEAPARLEIIDAMTTRLHYGKVRAVVPPSGHGFIVATEDVEYEDFGTEFGVQVDRSTGDSALHVFDGQVNVRKPDSHQLLKSVTQGQSAGYAEGEPTAVPDNLKESFLTPGAIGFLRWHEWSKHQTRDPSLIGYFPFIAAADDDVLPNAASSDVTKGAIHGARWVSGRWPGKQALLFDRDTDFAEFDVPGEYQELTIAAWVYIDHLDRVINAIVDSNGWEPGAVHLQIMRGGLPYVDIAEVRLPGVDRGWPEGEVTAGKWTHVAATMSVADQIARVYVNGVEIKASQLKAGGVIRPGSMRLGNWLAVGDYQPNRSFRGRIDELALWSRALDATAVKALVEAGRPDLLWATAGSGQ
jgi:hypothetical protein